MGPLARRVVLRLASVLLAGFGVLLFSVFPAAAEPPSDQETRGICATTDGTADYQYLPVERWSGATQQIHVRSGGGNPFDVVPFQRQMQGSTFAIGDFLYSVTTKFVMWSTDFCPLQSVGAAIDSAVAQFGERVFASPLIAGLLALATLGLLIQGLRREGQWLPRLFVKMSIVAILVLMVAGAGRSTTDASGRYVPGEGSPGWFATMIDQAITEIAAAPAAALAAPGVDDGVGVDQDELSCGAYINALKRGYEASARDKGTLIDAKTIPAQTVSNLWQVSGYRAWSVGQFGRDNFNGQSRVACRMLDHNARIPVTLGKYLVPGQSETAVSAATREDVLRRVPAEGIPDGSSFAVRADAPAWRQLDRVQQDRAWIAWAACVPKDGDLANLGAKDGWHTPKGQAWLISAENARAGADEGSSQLLNLSCYNFFNSDNETVSDIFDWSDGDSELKDVAGEMPPSIYDFISTLHGSNQGASGAALIGYLVSAIGVAGVFGTLGVIIMIVKAVAAFMLLSSVFVALLCLLPRADNDRLVRFLKIYVGLSLTAAFGVFLMSLITLFTNLILNLVRSFAGPNSDMTLILGGIAPVMAAIALHFAFKKAGMPSPLTVSGAMAWGGAMSGGSALGAIRTGGQAIVDRARGLVGRGGRASGGEDGGPRIPRKYGKRNSELDTEQRIPSKPAPARSSAQQEYQQIVENPKSTKEEVSAARSQLMDEYNVGGQGAGQDQVAMAGDQSQVVAQTQSGGSGLGSGAAASEWPALRQGAARVPSEWGEGRQNRKKRSPGFRWEDPQDPGNGIRIDKGNPGAEYPSQRVDHVVVRRGGRILGQDGAPIQGALKAHPEGHIPLDEWMTWKDWDRPG